MDIVFKTGKARSFRNPLEIRPYTVSSLIETGQ